MLFPSISKKIPGYEYLKYATAAYFKILVCSSLTTGFSVSLDFIQHAINTASLNDQ